MLHERSNDTLSELSVVVPQDAGVSQDQP